MHGRTVCERIAQVFLLFFSKTFNVVQLDKTVYAGLLAGLSVLALRSLCVKCFIFAHARMLLQLSSVCVLTSTFNALRCALNMAVPANPKATVFCTGFNSVLPQP